MKHFKSLAIIAFVVISCSTLISAKKEKTRYVEIETKFGTMKVMLYNETPLHRDNFLKLVKEGYYDSLLFHRVIKDFMIQGGDPDSKSAAANKSLGTGGPGYQINAEIIPGLYHKKGALSAARQGDQMNPDKKSSGSQFYIVQGKPTNEHQLQAMVKQINFPIVKDSVFAYVEKPENVEIKNKIDSLKQAANYPELNNEYSKIAELIEKELKEAGLIYEYSNEQIEVYKTLGGTPHLDNNYTVFGEVVEGLNIIDSIAAVKTDRSDRPSENIIMKMRIVKK